MINNQTSESQSEESSVIKEEVLISSSMLSVNASETKLTTGMNRFTVETLLGGQQRLGSQGFQTKHNNNYRPEINSAIDESEVLAMKN